MINEILEKTICEHALLDMTGKKLTIPCDLIGDLGINSIDLIMIIIDLEERLHISIDESDVDFSQLYDLSYFNEVIEGLIRKK